MSALRKFGYPARVSPFLSVHHVSPSQPGLHRKQAQHGERHQPNARIGERAVGQHSQRRVGRECQKQPLHRCLASPPPAGSRFIRARKAAQLWCTGEDSNLRTSLGGTDLQSVGFNHSPTCAETSMPRLRCGALSSRQPSTGFAHNGLRGYATQKNRSGAHTLAHEKSRHVGKVPNGVRLENLSRC
jgi:hypothetical protein